MLLQRQHQIASQQSAEPNLDDLVLRIRRLVQHRGYDRAQIGSSLLKRLAPSRAAYGQSFSEADLRRRLKDAALDLRAVNYLMVSADAEFDLARLRWLEA